MKLKHVALIVVLMAVCILLIGLTTRGHALTDAEAFLIGATIGMGGR